MQVGNSHRAFQVRKLPLSAKQGGEAMGRRMQVRDEEQALADGSDEKAPGGVIE